MKTVHHTLAALALAFASATSALATTYDLGIVTTAGTSFTGNLPGGNPWSTGPTSFTDYYTFTLAPGSAGAKGGVADTSLSYFYMGIDVITLTLSEFVGGAQVGVADNTPTSYTFSGLSAGTKYRLAVAGTVTGQPGFANWYAQYNGTIAAVASSAPEASELALSALGLAGVAFWSRRRAQVKSV